MNTWTTMRSPVGDLRIVAADDVLVAIDFAPHEPRDGVDDNGSTLLADARRQLDAYFAGELQVFDLPLAEIGTPFQLRVWKEIRTIPYGETTSYGDIARRLGLPPGASRAVGLANGRNPIPVVVPCHRVIGGNGRLIGYAGGLDRKRALLSLEGGALV